jgi:cytochrome c
MRAVALSLMILALGGSALAAKPAAPAQPAPVLANAFAPCAACHTAERNAANRLGPNLFGVFGRHAAALPGYSYSDAMRKSGLVWNRATLDRYLENPRSVVPGTRMPFSGLSDPMQRKAVIAFLRRRSPRR